jgi:hypothetical protein
LYTNNTLKTTTNSNKLVSFIKNLPITTNKLDEDQIFEILKAENLM